MNASELTILVIDDNHIRASIIEEGLREAGYGRVVVVVDINQVARTVEQVSPDVVVIDLENPNRDRLEHFFSLSRVIERPIAMFVDRSDASSIDASTRRLSRAPSSRPCFMRGPTWFGSGSASIVRSAMRSSRYATY